MTILFPSTISCSLYPNYEVQLIVIGKNDIEIAHDELDRIYDHMDENGPIISSNTGVVNVPAAFQITDSDSAQTHFCNLAVFELLSKIDGKSLTNVWSRFFHAFYDRQNGQEEPMKYDYFTLPLLHGTIYFAIGRKHGNIYCIKARKCRGWVKLKIGMVDYLLSAFLLFEYEKESRSESFWFKAWRKWLSAYIWRHGI